MPEITTGLFLKGWRLHQRDAGRHRSTVGVARKLTFVALWSKDASRLQGKVDDAKKSVSTMESELEVQKAPSHTGLGVACKREAVCYILLRC